MPAISRKSSWKPQQKREFVLESDVLPDDKVHQARDSRLVMLTLEGSNGKAYRYSAPIQIINF